MRRRPATDSRHTFVVDPAEAGTQRRSDRGIGVLSSTTVFASDRNTRMPLDTWLAFFVASWLISLSPGRRRDLVHDRRDALRLPARPVEHLRPPARHHVHPGRRRRGAGRRARGVRHRVRRRQVAGRRLSRLARHPAMARARRAARDRRRWRAGRRHAQGARAARLPRQRDQSQGPLVHARRAAAVHRSRRVRSFRSTRSAPARCSSPTSS